MKGPWLIYDNETGAYFSADGTGRGDRKFWVYRDADATPYPTRSEAARVISAKFSRLTLYRYTIVKLVGPRVTRAQQLGFAAVTDLARRYA